MRYDNIRAFEKHLEGAAPHHFSPLYVVVGKESYDCKEAVHLLQRFLIPENSQNFALKVWDGSQANEKDLVMDLYSQSFFIEKRVIFINQAEKLKKNIQDEIEKYIKKNNRSQYLILCASSLSRQSNFYKLLEKEGIILEFAELKPWDKEKLLIDRIGKNVAAARKLISFQVCKQFVKMIGLDQYALSSELEKLLCFVGDRAEITWRDVESICTLIPPESIWELGEAIFSRNAASSLKIIKSLLNEGQAFLQILRQIRSQFVTDLHVCMMLSQDKTSGDITAEFPYMKGRILDMHITNARRYGLRSFQKGLLEIDATELSAKNSGIDERLLAELLIIKLTLQTG